MKSTNELFKINKEREIHIKKLNNLREERRITDIKIKELKLKIINLMKNGMERTNK